MVSPSFVPPAQIRQLRDWTRARFDLVADRTKVKQRIEKLLEDALIKLSTVATDIFGVSGRAMMEALINGQRNPQALAGLARGKMRPKRDALIEALDGRFTGHHAALLRMLLNQIDHLDAAIAHAEAQIDTLIAALPAAPSPPHGRDSAATDRPDQAGYLSAVERLCEIPASAPTSPAPSSPNSAWT